MMIKASGNYKQTESCFIISTIVNIIISAVLSRTYGLVGVAIGTLVAMGYQTIYLAIYVYQKLIFKRIMYFIKQLLIDIILFAIINRVGILLTDRIVDYFSWIFVAIKISVIALVILLVANMIFETNKVISVIKKN